MSRKALTSKDIITRAKWEVGKLRQDIDADMPGAETAYASAIMYRRNSKAPAAAVVATLLAGSLMTDGYDDLVAGIAARLADFQFSEENK